ncbi:YolD-like family protein [Sporosarcina sp. FSL K6-2383]|uniref:YolD-like family protein n=1 Tax=Sporosarcina sp. FSL K6-2383 TaxID=2921556 RepID=UPI00315A129F
MLDKVRDRGKKKWSMAMMLTEHVEKLKSWYAEDGYEERPELDDFDLQSIQEEIEVAYKRKCLILIATWKDGKIIPKGGVIKEINVQSMFIFLDDPFGGNKIDINDIIGSQIRE